MERAKKEKENERREVMNEQRIMKGKEMEELEEKRQQTKKD